MTYDQSNEVLPGVVLDDESIFSLADLSRHCRISAEQLINMVDYGLIKPLDSSGSCSHWRFSGSCLLRVEKAIRLQRDLELNLPGIALALELLDEIHLLRQTVAALKRR